jgi:MFS family permease
MGHGVSQVPAGRLNRFGAYFGLERNLLIMTLAGTLQGIGVALWSGFLPKVLQELGATGVIIGAFGTVGALVGLLFPYVGGSLSDRLGRGRSLVLASGLSLAGYLVYLVSPVWPLFFLGALLTSAGAQFSFMGSLALVGDVLDSRRRATSIAVQNIIGRLPPGLMPPLGGALIVTLGLLTGVRLGVLITVVLTLAGIWLQRRYYRLPRPAARPAPFGLRGAWRAMGPGLKRLLMADCLVRFGSGLSVSFVVLYVMDVLGGSALDFGLMTTTQTLISVIVYLPVAKLADRAGQASRWPFIALTYLMFAAFPLALAVMPAVTWLYAVFVIAGLRELGEPARKALIVDLAGEQHRGSLIGVYFTILSGVVFPASVFGGWMWDLDPVLPFLIGAGITGCGLLWFLWGVTPMVKAGAARA